MIFSLDVRRARKGDCLLLHCGSKAEPGLIMIDGGPKTVFAEHLRPRLEEIAEARELDGSPLPVDLLMVSHVDDDHIQGILDLTKELLADKAARRAPIVDIAGFWHNSFDKLSGNAAKKITATFTAQFGAAATEGEPHLDDDKTSAVEVKFSAANPDIPGGEVPEIVSSAMLVLASIGQGVRLQTDARGLGLIPNEEFVDKLIVAREENEPVDFGYGLTFTVVGPMAAELEALRKKHKAWLEEHAEDEDNEAALAAYVDKSVPNLSSIVLLAACGGKTMLLTGDARGDKILEGLELTGCIDEGGKLKVNILKVPHHGSSNNLDNDFFERIHADHYVFSGNGEHGNPEREALEMLAAARGDADYTIHFTYDIDEIDKARKADWVKEQGKEKKRGKADPRPNWSPARHGLRALFDNDPALLARLKVADPVKPHVIDLGDPLGY